MISDVPVKLATYEILQAAFAGLLRGVENIKNGCEHKYGAIDSWELDIEGALGECALAKHLQVYWSGKGEMRGYDVGNVDVRTTRGQENRLIIHKDDDGERIFWLVCGERGTYNVKGWILGSEGQDEKYWTDVGNGRPAFFIPQSALNRPQARYPEYYAE